MARSPETSNGNLVTDPRKAFGSLIKPARNHAQIPVKILSGQQMGLKQLALLVHPDKSRHPRTGPSCRQGLGNLKLTSGNLTYKAGVSWVSCLGLHVYALGPEVLCPLNPQP